MHSMQRFHQAILAALLAVVFLSPSCSTGKGSSFRESRDAQSDARSRDEEREAERPRDDDRTVSDTNDWWWNRRQPGEPDPALPETMVIEVKPRELGTLELTGDPLPDDILVDGFPAVVSRRMTLEAGERHLVLRRFGQENVDRYITIPVNGTALLAWTWTPAAFRMDTPYLSRAIFNPEGNPGRDSVLLTLACTAPGKARIRVEAPDGSTVAEQDISLSARTTSWTWNGRTTDGTVLPKGTYRIVVEAVGNDGIVLSGEVEATISPDLVITVQGHSGMGPGLALVPWARALDSAAFQGSFRAGGTNHDGLWYGVVAGDLRLGTVQGMEVDATGGAILSSEAELTEVFTQVQTRVELASPPAGERGITLSGFAGFTWQNWADGLEGHGVLDDRAEYPGLSGGLIFQADAGPVQLHLATEMVITDRPWWGSVLYGETGDNLYPFARGRAGLSIATSRVCAGVSAALRTDMLTTDLRLDSTFQVAAEAHVCLQDDTWMGLTAIANVDTMGSWYVQGFVDVSGLLTDPGF